MEKKEIHICSSLINTLAHSTQVLTVQNVTVTHKNLSELTAELNRERKPDQDIKKSVTLDKK